MSGDVKLPRAFGEHHRRALDMLATAGDDGVHIGARTRFSSAAGVDGAISHAHVGFLDRQLMVIIADDGRGRRAYITGNGIAVLAAANKRAELTR